MDTKHEITDPFYYELCPGAKYNIIGLINCEIEMTNVTKRRQLLHQVAIRLGVRGNYTQAIIKIWSSAGREEPKFAPNWLRLQLAFIRDAIFVGEREKFGLSYLQFVLPSNKSSRFIWLTSPEEDFWRFPIPKPESRRSHTWQAKLEKESCPWQGIVECSQGSVFGPSFLMTTKTIHSRATLGCSTFSDFYRDVLNLKRDLLFDGERLMCKSKREALFNITEGPFYMHM